LACGDLIGISTATQPTGSYRERLKRYVVGERWTAELRADSQRGMKEVAHARKRLAAHARGKLGQPRAELFGHGEGDDASAITPP